MSRTYYRTNPETGEVERSITPFSHPMSQVPVFVDLYMDGTRSADGVDIGTRAKRREYMKATGAADHSDFKGVFERGTAARDALRTGNHDDKALTCAVDQAWEKRK